MKVTDYIAYTIDRFPKGYVFTYEDFNIEVNSQEAVIKALNRLAKSGRISKLSKGKYYKPEKTPFGELQPNQEQIVKDLIEKDGKLIGYLTGYSIYNKLGLTSQVSNTIQIGKNEIRPTFKRERYTIAFVKQRNTITKKNIPLLQILDSIRYIKKIPDSSLQESTRRILKIIQQLSAHNKRELTRLSLKYPPSTRALLGSILSEIDEDNMTYVLRDSLNPITKYRFPGAAKVLPSANDWNIS